MTSPLVTAGEVPPAALLLDVRWTLSGSDRAAYEAEHLPGAVFCDLDRVLADPPGAGGRHPLPGPDELAGRLARLGVSVRRPVVAYDGGAGAAAARAWWCLRWLGHRDVRVLDGGLPAWRDAGRPLEAGWVEPEPVPDAGLPAPGFPHLPVLDAEGAARTARDGVLLDARSPERFRGEAEPVDPVAGRIPGAVNAPDPAVAADVVGDVRPVGAYCGSGVSAAQTVLALSAAGIEAALYPGSWSEWVTDPSRPVARG
ncbi:MAG: sulfurtransferase [Actinomycetes bacterium]